MKVICLWCELGVKDCKCKIGAFVDRERWEAYRNGTKDEEISMLLRMKQKE